MNQKLFRWFFLFVIMVLMTFGISFSASAETPQYGGTLRAYVRPTINPFTWDTNDWGWKINEDTSLVYEHMLVGDLQKGPRGTNEYSFKGDAFVPPYAVRGELAESWQLKENPLRIEFQLRKGIFWQGKKGVMKSREFVADDVVYFFNRVMHSKKAIPTFWDFMDRWEAKGKYKVTMYMKYFNANWDYRMGWGYYNSVSPKEVVSAGPRNWRNITGTGPYSYKKYQKGSYQKYLKNPNYWDSTMIDGVSYKLPFANQIYYMLNKDEQSRLSALRSGKVDIATGIRWNFAAELKKQHPELKWSKIVHTSPLKLAMRMDIKPFNDIRVRRAMALAVNQQEILDHYWGGEGELFSYPFPSSWKGFYVPLNEQPKDVQELYSYNPEKAKKLLADAGYPNGFTVKANVNSSSQPEMEQAQLVVGYLSKIGVNLVLVPMEYRQWLGTMVNKKHEPGIFMGSGHSNPLAVLRKNYVSNQTWNPYMMADSKFDAKWREALTTIDKSKRQKMMQELTTYALQQVPSVELPDPYNFIAWWPWVKNYYGEFTTGAVMYGPIHARIWIDQKLKKKMGY